ncbi:Diaminopimelate decarboxylase [Trichoplax sp. H2]|nr:Diaminopimelate decarboxylase [Trichoplax sp. H2]|eukprot:RDD42246.1 Diaminopimelate decarboxylase [Trichoplax sp. H2]
MYKPSLEISQRVTEKHGTPVFVTDSGILHRKVQILKDATGKNTKVYYALKANYNPHIIRELKAAGIDGIDAVAPFEIKLAKQCGFKSQQIIFTGNNSDDQELAEVHAEGVIPNIGSISELERFGAVFNGAEVSIRFNPGIGDGETKMVITGGKESKFGILLEEIEQAKQIIRKYHLQLIGVHCHIGSGFYAAEVFESAVYEIFKIAANFKSLKFIDLGGGFGVMYEPDSKPVRIKQFFNCVEKYVKEFTLSNGREINMIVEPGKFLVAESTCLLVKVTNIKKNGEIIFIGTDSGMNHIIRPALYGSYHHIINISNPDAPLRRVTVVGNICESSDTFGENLEIALPQEGDLLAILTAGAYCASMSSLYNLRPYAAEVLVNGQEIRLIRERLDYRKIMQGLGFTM